MSTKTLTGDLDMAADFWKQGDDATCTRCDLYYFDGETHGACCTLLYDMTTPNGDCLGLFERDGTTQP